MEDAPLFDPLPLRMPLPEWLDRMAKLAGYRDGDAMVSETGVCCWMDYYESGYTPGEAWSEECSE